MPSPVTPSSDLTPERIAELHTADLIPEFERALGDHAGQANDDDTFGGWVCPTCEDDDWPCERWLEVVTPPHLKALLDERERLREALSRLEAAASDCAMSWDHQEVPSVPQQYVLVGALVEARHALNACPSCQEPSDER